MASSMYSNNSQSSNEGKDTTGPFNVTTVIEEGFICAECHRQFPGVEELLKHYKQRCSSVHSGSGNTTGSIKGLLGKAKEKLQVLNPQQLSNVSNNHSNSQNSAGSGSNTSSTTPTYNDLVYVSRSTPLGTTRSHLEQFKKIRASRNERYASEGNKLVIRLFKLLNFDKSSGIDFSSPLTSLTSQAKIDERRAHEKSVVEWIEEKNVNRCPDCTLPFKSLLPVRRKHHCRLCGSVLCDECSRFITLEQAKMLTARLKESSGEQEVSKSGRRSSSVLSSNAEISFRSCGYCYSLLEQQRMKLDHNTFGDGNSNGNNLVALYNNLQANIKEIDRLTPELVTIADSLYRGESLHSVQYGNEVRSKLIKLTESIDLLSKRIASLAVGHSEVEQPNQSWLRLQQRIRQSCIVFIRDSLGSLPIIPTEEQTKKIREEISRRESNSGRGSPMLRRNDPVQVEVLSGSGWSAGPRTTSSNPFETDDFTDGPNDSDNPILQQIENVKHYIEQARAAEKWDEVVILEESLEDLKRELEFVQL